MDFSKQKVTVKPSAGIVMGSGSPSSSITSGQPMVIRAKVSGSARTRAQTSTTTTVSVTGAPKPGNVRLNLTPDSRIRSPSPVKFTVRSPSPSKFMRPTSPVKSIPQAKLTQDRTPASMSRATLRSARVDKTSNSMVTMFDEGYATTSSAPSSLLHKGEDNDNTTSKVSKMSTNSLRVKAKVTNLTKPTLQTVPTILSPPPPSIKTSAIPSPVMTNRPRVRTMTTTRRPSIPLPLTVDDSRLIPLPTSPPTSTLSFSSHSSTSISSVPSYSSSDVDTLSTTRSGLPYPLNGVSTSDQKTSEDPSTRNLVARVRANTQISGGLSRTSSHSPPLDNEDGRMEENEAMFGDDDNLTYQPKALRSRSQEREDEERAEAKSNRKIADLEITTKSLLSINASLEAAKARQASEIRELRRKLRQARLALPPKRYKLLSEDDRAEDKNEDDGGSTDVEEGEEDQDESFLRIKHMVEELLTVGRNALAAPAPAFGLNPSGNMMMNHAEGEVLTWDASTGNNDHGQRNWKHVVAIGSRVLTADEAKKWTEVTEEADDDGDEVDAPEGDISHSNTLEEEKEVEEQIRSEPLNPDTISTAESHEDSNDDIDAPP